MKRIILVICLIAAFALSAYEMDTLVDAPTAGMLQKGETEIHSEFYKDNGLLLGVKVCVVQRLMIGVSYGAEQVVGNADPQWHDKVEFYGKFRLLDESYKVPALALGFDSQGHGRFYRKDTSGNEIRRYDIKSKGFFLVMSKNFAFLGNLGLHLGTNYSLEGSNENQKLNLFAGFDKTIGDVVVLSSEYDLAINDNGHWLEDVLEEVEYQEKGYLNAALGIYFTPNLYFQLKFNDLLGTRGDTMGADRAIRVKYYFDI